MDIQSIIRKKRESKELNHDEIRYFIGKYTKDEITDAQAAALMSYIYINGLTEKEILEFVKAMAESGDMIDLSKISNNIVDKHSTGGVGDKVTIILMPVIAALGIPVAKISSRGLGISGGTIDKLESIPGFGADISVEEFKTNIEKIGVSIMSQNLNVAPAESKMYKLRNQIACSDSLPLIAASLMSLKLATGGNKFVFDITCGKGTYIKTKEDAKKLAKLLNKLGKSLGKEVGCVITSMDEPLGYAIGHNLEIKETIAALRGSMPQDVGEVVVALGSVMLSLATEQKNLDQNAAIIRETIKSGKAFAKFKEMVAAQYGSLAYLDNPEKFPEAKHIMPVYANDTGIIESIDADMVGSIAGFLGAGRMKSEFDINRRAGIVLKKKIGDLVQVGEVVAYIHTDDEDKVLGATKNLEEAFVITHKKLKTTSRVLEIL